MILPDYRQDYIRGTAIEKSLVEIGLYIDRKCSTAVSDVELKNFESPWKETQEERMERTQGKAIQAVGLNERSAKRSVSSTNVMQPLRSFDRCSNRPRYLPVFVVVDNDRKTVSNFFHCPFSYPCEVSHALRFSPLSDFVQQL